MYYNIKTTINNKLALSLLKLVTHTQKVTLMLVFLKTVIHGSVIIEG